MVIAVLALFICTVCTPWGPPEGHYFRANGLVVQSDLHRMSQALENYAADHEGASAPDLDALIVQGGGRPAYLANYTSTPRDPWHRPYLYELRAGGSGRRLWTLGSDGEVGGSGEARDQSVESK